MLRMGLKCPHSLSKQAENYILASDWQYYDILDIPPSEGAKEPTTKIHLSGDSCGAQPKYFLFPTNGPKMSSFIVKTSRELHFGFRLAIL